ncbi:MAG TPA: ATP-dependent helicase HrpB [Spongiibacteraceae bacterium]|nr:ATP-dependent helicase HrpB [Spongiibacteraceae bacterium]
MSDTNFTLPLSALPAPPIVEILPALAQALRQCPRVVIEAPPGAGKSTYLPLWLATRGANSTRRILLIQPRRLAASNVARYLAKQIGSSLGEKVGLRTRYDRKVSAQTIIEVITEGIFLRQIQRDPELRGVDYVLFDEYHERSWQADTTLAFALESQAQWRSEEQPLHLLIMSATLPAEALADWLKAPVVRSLGRSFPVQVGYAPPGRADPIEHLAAQIERVVRAGAIKTLVFLAGWQPMQRLQRRLAGRIDGDIYLLHSSLPAEQQQLAMAANPSGRAAVVLATNIAETSLTIDGIDTVIDSGQVRRPRFDPSRGMDRLETGWISRASAEQRAGRAGRLGPGRCIRLWSQEQQGRLVAHDAAEIQQVDLAPLALELALWSSEVNVENILPERPSPQRLAEARHLLVELGAIDSKGRITTAGRDISDLGLHPRLGRLVQRGREHGWQMEACGLAALLSEGDFLRREGGDLSADIEWRMQLLREGGQNSAIQHGVMQRIKQLTQQLLQRDGTRNGERKSTAGVVAPSLGVLLLAAFPDRIARQRQDGGGRYLGIDGFELVLGRDDALARQRWLVIAEHDGGRQGARIELAAAISEEDVIETLDARIQHSEELAWDEVSQRLSAKRMSRLGAIVLDERLVAIDDERAAATWLCELRKRGCDWLRWSDRVEALLGRIRWAQSKAAALPDFSESGLLATLEDWLLPYLPGIRRLDDLRALDFMAILRARLDYAQQQQLAQLAPERWLLPSGVQHDIQYRADAAPKLAARLTEFYGLDRHPSIGGEALLLELLSPAYRPVQLTKDLPGFWRSSYTEVRKEMKGRYPKHFWPEQPWSAPATLTTKKRMPSAPH